jgi:CubicO group peptidase (beta-lactamase class C family)
MHLSVRTAILLAATIPAFSQSIRRLDGSSLSATEANGIADKELKDNNVMGAQMAILNGGHVVWTHTYGLRDAEKHLPMTADTNIWAASITKGVFAAWVMHLVEQHRLDLDRPIAKILPRPLNEYEPYRDSASLIVLDPQWQLVTPRILLSHTSGLTNLIVSDEPDKKLHLHFKPGSRYAYSGDGLNVLQFALEEEVLHEKLEEAMQRDLFTPLGMTRSGLVWHEDFASDITGRYDAWRKYLDTTHRDHSRAAGSMATTITDLARFTEALLANKIIRPATRAQMLTPQIKINAAHQFPTNATEISGEGPGVGLAYGLGWGLLATTKFGPAFFKEGHGNGSENYMICFTRSNTCMIMLTNSDNGELAFRPLFEQLIGDTVTPWEWEGYTREHILHNEEHTPPKQ